MVLLGGCNPTLPGSGVPTQALPLAEVKEGKVTVVGAGDILMHNTLIDSGRQPDGTYVFDHLFAPIGSLLAEGDLAFANLEAAMAGPASGYTGYPLFNSPDEVAAAMGKAGIDLVVTANNHILDRGIQGAARTLEVLEGKGLGTVGTTLREDPLLIREANGVKVGFLAYTYSTNGMPLPNPQSGVYVRMLEKKRVLADLATHRPRVDVLVLILHWGVEYQTTPTREQRELAQAFLEGGADAIVGSHPHVVQPFEMIPTKQGVKPLFFAIGNLVGDQRGPERNSGVIAKLTWTKDGSTGRMTLQEATYTPTFSHRYWEDGRLKLRVVPLEKTIAEVRVGKDPYLTAADLPTLEKALKDIQKQILRPRYRRE